MGGRRPGEDSAESSAEDSAEDAEDSAENTADFEENSADFEENLADVKDNSAAVGVAEANWGRPRRKLLPPSRRSASMTTNNVLKSTAAQGTPSPDARPFPPYVRLCWSAACWPV